MKRHHGTGTSAASDLRGRGRAQLACVGSMLMIVIATAAWGFDAHFAPDVSGVFPDRAPRGLRANDWAVLDGNWEQWSTETADAVIAFYEAEDAASRSAALDRLHVKLNTMETCLADPDYSMIHADLASLHGRLSRRVAVADAVYEMTDLDAARAGQAAAAYDAVHAALETLRSDLARIPGGSAWLPYVRADEVAAVVAGDDASANAQEVLATAHGKIVRREGLNPEQAEFLGRESFFGLSAALEEAIAALNWSPPDGYQEQLVGQLAQLVAAIEEYEEDGGSEAAAAIRSHYNSLSDAAAGGSAPISRAMRNSYFNFNARIIASEGLMRRFSAETRTEPGIINEPVNEAWVSGRSCTVTNVSVDLKPNNQVAQLNIVLDGTVRMNTTANTSQATVYGGSSGTFHAVKPVYFDGHEFNLDPSRVSANVSTYSTDVDAKVFFLLRPIADLIATNEVARRKPQSDATARTRVANRVSGEMDTEVGEQFANASTKLQADVYGPLRELGWYPEAIRMSTTETELLARVRLMEPMELGACTPSWIPSVPSNGIVIQVHESALNNGGARLGIAGRTMSESELRAELESRLKKLFGEDFQLRSGGDEEAAPQPEQTAEPADENVFIFDTVDPLQFEIEDGAVSIIMRTGLRREGEDDIDTHIISVPLSFHVDGDQILMERIGNVRVVPAPGVARNIPQQGIMRRHIEEAISDRTLDTELQLKQQDKTITLHVSDIQAIDGWVSVTAQ